MSFFNAAINYLADRRHLRQVILGAVGLLILGAAVLFGSDIEKLLNPPQSSAAYTLPPGAELAWQVSSNSLNYSRSSAQLVDVTSNGKRYLYLIGGIDKRQDSEGKQRVFLVDNVERLPLGPDGAPLSGNAIWESSPSTGWGKMNSGHAGFKAFQYGQYLYVVSGDIHVPNVDDPSIDNPLLFSTIERLDLSDPNAAWQVYGLLTGVNFYPEILLDGNQLHVVGGIYGNPFTGASRYNWGPYLDILDPLSISDDAAKWDSVYKTKTRIGDVGVSLPDGLPGAVIRTGLVATVVEPDLSLSSSAGVQAQQVTPESNNFAKQLSDQLIKGNFAATVSEHYIIQLDNAPNVRFKGELGVNESNTITTDYLGRKLSESWPTVSERDKVGHLAHLRFEMILGVDPQYGTWAEVQPVPQGRYGFKLIKNNNEILLFGGASWNSPTGEFGALNHDYPFWVIDDEEMYYQVLSPNYPYPIIYQYVGNIAYKYFPATKRWQGTNGSHAGATDGGLPHGDTDLSATYAFHDSSLSKKGRAFFGFAKVESGSDNFEYVAVGGLESGDKSASYPAFVHITITDRVERFTSSGWVSNVDDYIKNDYPKPYNPSAIGINDQVVLFDGQTQFREGEGLVADPPYSELNNHVPDYRKPANNDVSMLSAGQWFDMAGFGEQVDGQTRGIPDLIFSAVLDVRSAAVGGGTTVYIYKVGGSTPSLDYLPVKSSAVQILGPFTYGQGGKVDWSKSYLTVEPQDGSTADPPVLKADGSDYATVTLHAVDYLSQPVQVQDGTAVTLYTLNDDGTNRSFHPAIKKSDKPDWIEVVGYTTSPSGWGADYTDQFVLIDRGANEDGNTATSLGEAQFTISSRVPTSPQLHLKIHAINIKQNPSLSLPTPIGDQPLIFTADGVPDDQYSTVEADPEQVEVGGTSTVTVTLKDHDQIPVADYSVRLFTMPSLSMGGQGAPITIDPTIDTTNTEGKATFSVSADVALLVMVQARYAINDDFLAESPYEHSVMLNDSAFIEFKAFIVSLSPNHAFQGSQLPVSALGKGTHWQTGKTQAQFIAPATLSFSLNTGGDGTDIYSHHYVADGRTIIPLKLMAPGYPNKQATLTVLSGGDLMSSDYVKTMTVTTDSEGVATFSYRVGTEPGISKIHAQVSGGPTDELWLIEEDPQLHPYELRVFADPSSLGGSITQSRIQAVVYAYGERLQEEGIEITLDSDDSGTFSDDHPTTDANGIAQAMYNKDSSPGPVRIFATTAYGSNFVADQILVSKSSVSGNITFSGLGITDPTHLTINDVLVPNDAVVGDWTVQVTTASNLPGEPGEVVSAIFTVDPYNVISGPALTPPLSPSGGLRGTTITLSVNGNDDTHFFKGADTRSLVRFVPPTGSPAGSENGIKVDDDSLVVVSPTQLHVSINIREFAVTGLWDISVTTGNEVAIMPGIGDFLVSDESNYVLDIYSDAPNSKLPRDGNARAKITVFLAQIDPLNGQRTPLGGVDVTLVNDDAGTLAPKDNQGRTIIRTSNGSIGKGKGFAEATYKVDAGDTNEPVTITASASPVEGIDVANFTTILKEVTPYTGFVVSANPAELPLQGEPSISTLSFTGLPPGAHQVTFELNDSPKGHIDSNANPTTTTTRYIADDIRIPETVEFRAWTTLPGIGIVWSNTATIEVGLADSKYKLTSLTAAPDHVQAGSTETSTITAHLTYNNNPVVGWPIEFEVVNGGFGDYVTPPRANTVNGNAVTTFVPGPLPANVIVRARAVGLSLVKEVVITKDVNQTIDPLRSSMWAAPTHVPISDGSKYSVVTVLLKNSNDTPLSGKTVTLTASLGTVRKGDGTPGNTGVTDGTGRVRFRVSSTALGTSTISASVDSYHPTTQIVFETGTLITQRIKVVVPFQARDYDNEVLIYLKKNGSLSDADVFVNGYYTKNPQPNNELADLNATTIYLRPNTTYRVWVKGRYHLAKSQTFITGGTDMGANENPVAITFTELAVGDLLPNTHRVNNNDVPLPFHDNAVNVVDLPPIYSAWFQNADIPDFLRDFVINTADWLYWFNNYGNGELGGPPPYDQRL